MMLFLTLDAMRHFYSLPTKWCSQTDKLKIKLHPKQPPHYYYIREAKRYNRTEKLHLTIEKLLKKKKLILL